MPVTEALSAVLGGADPLPEETVALDAAHHRVLARDIAALRTQPPQAMSAMDGYAVRSVDASRVAAQLKVIGEVAAGRPFEKAVGAGEAVRIFTGGVIPDGALHYVPFAALRESNSAGTPYLVQRFVISVAPALRFIAAAGPAPRAATVVVSHAAALVSALDAHADCRQIVLEKQLGETVVRDGTPPDWTWPSR